MSLWIDFEKHQSILKILCSTTSTLHWLYSLKMIRGFSLYAVIYIIVIQIMLWLVTTPVWRLMLATISLFWTYTMVQFITRSTPFTVDTVGNSRDLATVHFIWVSVVIVYHYICYSVSNSYWARSMYAVTVKPMCSLINTVL